MNKRRLFDARHITEIFLWTLKRKGSLRAYPSHTGDTIIHLSCSDSPSIDMLLRTRDIDVLAGQLWLYTAIDAFGSSKALPRALAQIALIANNAGPKVSGLSAKAEELTPLLCEICTDFAVACAIAFADFHEYVVDPGRIPQHETFIALLMKDETLLKHIFSGALRIAPSIQGRGRHARPENPEHSAEEGPEELLRDLEEQAADANPIPGPGRNGRERQLSAESYRNIRSIGELEGWSADDLLMLIDEHLSPYGVEHDAEILLPDLEEQLAAANSILSPSLNGGERRLSATSYWNLRSVAELEAWSAAVVLILIGEHLSPTLRHDLVHHSDSVSGPDWRRLYAWIFPANGSVLWKIMIESRQR